MSQAVDASIDVMPVKMCVTPVRPSTRSHVPLPIRRETAIDQAIIAEISVCYQLISYLIAYPDREIKFMLGVIFNC